MFVRIDQQPKKQDITGYSYMNQSGIEESVSVPTQGRTGVVRIKDSCDDEIIIYRDDVPNLIKALQAAYDHKD